MNLGFSLEEFLPKVFEALDQKKDLSEESILKEKNDVNSIELDFETKLVYFNNRLTQQNILSIK